MVLKFVPRIFVLTEKVVVWVSLIFEGKSSIADMVEILQPLKIRHSHTTSIQVHVLQETTCGQMAACVEQFSVLHLNKTLICFIRCHEHIRPIPETYMNTTNQQSLQAQLSNFAQKHIKFHVKSVPFTSDQ